MISELNKAYGVLNENLFEGNLQPPSFRVDLTVKPAFRYRGERSPDIIIGAGFSEISVNGILDGLLHVMIHVRNYALGIEDCTTNQYHKRAFSEKALDLGLAVMKTPSRGWGVTTSQRSEWLKFEEVRTPTSLQVRKRHDAYEKVHINLATLSKFKAEIKEKLNSVKKKQFQFKYVCECPPPHNSIRSGRKHLNAGCRDCGAKYKISDT